MKLLLGMSGDEASWQALERTLDRVGETGDDLTVAVVDRPTSDSDPGTVLSEVRSRIEDSGVEAEVRRLEGDPGSELVRLAEQEPFDRLVIGGGEKSPMGKMELDGMEQYVLLNARTTVTIER
jgi:nucleotide-binding universal stress UspA family protein